MFSFKLSVEVTCTWLDIHVLQNSQRKMFCLLQVLGITDNPRKLEEFPQFKLLFNNGKVCIVWHVYIPMLQSLTLWP